MDPLKKVMEKWLKETDKIVQTIIKRGRETIKKK